MAHDSYARLSSSSHSNELLPLEASTPILHYPVLIPRNQVASSIVHFQMAHSRALESEHLSVRAVDDGGAIANQLAVRGETKHVRVCGNGNWRTPWQVSGVWVCFGRYGEFAWVVVVLNRDAGHRCSLMRNEQRALAREQGGDHGKI